MKLRTALKAAAARAMVGPIIFSEPFVRRTAKRAST